jgi:hypothetical protein
MDKHTEESIAKLIKAAKKGLDILIEEIERPLERDELNDDKARNAIKAKNECFKDAQEMIHGISRLESQLQGEEGPDGDVDFAAGAAERFAGGSSKHKKK